MIMFIVCPICDVIVQVYSRINSNSSEDEQSLKVLRKQVGARVISAPFRIIAVEEEEEEEEEADENNERATQNRLSHPHPHHG
jgi:hypothetical protein